MKTTNAPMFRLTPLAATLLLAGTAWGAPPPTSPYATDISNEYVQDATSDGMSNLNMVLCIMNAMAPADMLTRKGAVDGAGVTDVKYIALVDKNKCDSRSRSSASNSASGASGATATPNYMTAVLDVSRGANATDPMIAKVWMSLTEEGHQTDVSVKISATTDPVTLPPYGRMRLDYVGYSGGAMMFNGFIDANGPAVSHVETGNNSSNVKLALSASDAFNGNGVIEAQYNNGGSSPTTVDYTFAYSGSATTAGYFARNPNPPPTSHANDVCFDRTKANAQKSVWRYGVYDATSGARFDQLHPGFPIAGTAGSGIAGATPGQTMYGFAGYWGINFGGLDQSAFASLPDGQVTAITNITDQRPGRTTSYNFFKNGGKLTQWTQHQTNLGAMDGVPFNFWTDMTGQTADPGIAGANNWVVQWNSASLSFTVIGKQSCDGNGCVVAPVGPAAITGTVLNMAINGWSDSFGGNINIPPKSGTRAIIDPLFFYSQTTVVPSVSSSLSLHCLSNCLTTASAGAFDGTNNPFGNGTDRQWFSGTSTVSYTFGATGLVESGGSTPLVLTNPAFFSRNNPANNPQFINGVMSGRLFDDANWSGGACPAGFPSGAGASCEPADPHVYYTYQTGPNQWNQATWLTDASGVPVTFDPPVQFQFTVPSDAAFTALYGTAWSGKSIQLQFNGFGNLNGIPGNCVDANNAPTSCGPSARYVAAFALADDTVLNIAGTSVLVRALDAELHLKQLSSCPAGLDTSSVTASLPTATPNNPAASGDPAFIGAKPAVTGAPGVIDGVMQ